MKNYEQTLLEMMADDERIIVMTAENRAAIRNPPNLAPRPLHRHRHYRTDDGRGGRRAGLAAASPYSTRWRRS